jgi:hypothetical protein
VFSDNSRYIDIKTVEAEIEGGRKVTAVRLRRLPYATGTPTVVKGNDRLDVMAQRNYSDGTRFWHIADANTELAATDLLKQRVQDKDTRVIRIPEK